MSNVYDTLVEREIIAQCTNEEKVREILENENVSFYIGFDPTADSLHIGHFVQIMVMVHMQRAGHRPIALVGGGTGKIGDPSGKTDMRKMLTDEELAHNVESIKSQLSRFLDFGEGKAIMVNNADWLLKLNYVEFLRDIGVHFSVNRMLAAECFKQRLEKGLNFIEFNYMLMQSYDFLKLYQDYECRFEFGGDDQWSNIIGGVELIRRVEGAEAFGVTFKLLTNSEGVKMGKTVKGAVWLDKEKTPPYELYQYLRNVDDADVIKCLKMLTFVPLEEIREMEKLEGSEINQAKVRLAYEVTKMVHGEEEAEKAKSAAESLFGGSKDSDSIPSTEIDESFLTDGSLPILDALLESGLIPSKAEGRRLIKQGGVYVNDEKVPNFDYAIPTEQLEGDGVLIRKGKKTYHRVYVN
ncbi:MAG TPA: tyrosine--tRNA ligase [Clostridiaceae bacterium]|jgi:tyrosyl-tRNA synthetase|nr:tyrosine--tRNA ligase [Clostridiaceae bacterium]HOA31154.1 tyrosine--tRNA ligase [Clostridia bacterium]